MTVADLQKFLETQSTDSLICIRDYEMGGFIPCIGKLPEVATTTQYRLTTGLNKNTDPVTCVVIG